MAVQARPDTVWSGWIHSEMNIMLKILARWANKAEDSRQTGPVTLRRRSMARQSMSGYSLLEIMIVMMIIAMLATLVGPRLFAQLDRSKSTTAEIQIKALSTAIEQMRLDIGRYPTEQEGLGLLADNLGGDPDWMGPYLDEAVPDDPWKRPYIYLAPAEAGTRPLIVSYGANGTEGGEGADADVFSTGR
ncbi:MAG: type II secretion system protein GspG [Alphaproteobacteria bacterium]|nr:type II secretion system protein GspG [Alphaproteobacteria bacterium]